uniref:Uncharacterized protein n=1 Tax=Rhizophora mucronata TaxID=61149 RepID=A0A2P2PH29_RHIMU
MSKKKKQKDSTEQFSQLISYANQHYKPISPTEAGQNLDPWIREASITDHFT